MQASTSTRWSKELSGKKDGDTGEGNSIYPRWTLLPFITVTKAILSHGRVGVAGDEEKRRSFRLYSFSLRNEICFKGEERRQLRQESPLRKVFDDTNESCLSWSIWNYLRFVLIYPINYSCLSGNTLESVNRQYACTYYLYSLFVKIQFTIKLWRTNTSERFKFFLKASSILLSILKGTSKVKC